MLTEQGAVLHAGSNCHGQLGAGLEDGHAHPKLCPVDLGGHRAVDIACGWSHIAVALSTGAALTWGQVSRYWQSTTYGCSGLGRDGDWKIPGMAEGVAEVERVYAGETFTFFLSRGGEVAACGDNICGQLCLGHPTHERVDRPQRAAPLCGRRILQLQASALQCIMLEEDGSVWVWGAGVRHEGDFDTWSDDSWSDSREVVPIRLAVGPALCVAAGYDDRCAAVTVKGVLMQWRYLWYPWRPPPVPLPGGQPATAVVCNDASIWARSSKGEWAVRARGRDYGQPIEGRLVRELRPIKPIKAADLSHCLPLTGSQSHFALYLEGQEAEAVWRRSVGFPTSGVLSVSGRELGEEDYEALLSDVGVSAECLVELLRVPRLPPAAGCAPPPMARALVVYVCAPRFGRAEPVCVELQPDATVLDLVAAAAESLGV